MRVLVHMTMLVCMVVAGLGTTTAAQVESVPDLADVPLPVQALPEDGYQVLAGDYLDASEIVTLIADARNLDETTIAGEIEDLGIERAYVLDLVLPEDRAWQQSPVLAVQQTSIYLLEEGSSTDELTDLLNDHSATRYVMEEDPAVEGGAAVATVGESGDMLRTVVSDDEVVIEIVSMDATGAPGETEHSLIVQGTIDRLDQLRTGNDVGLSSVALKLQQTDDSATFAHSQQTGVHGLYRLRDGEVQPAIGELDAAMGLSVPGLQSHYLSSDISRTGGGTAIVSVSLARFDSNGAANKWFDGLTGSDPSQALVDPFFVIDGAEEWVASGTTGVYRVTGTLDGDRYSGYVEIRLIDDTVVTMAYRSVGAALPGAAITSALMNYQRGCIESAQACPAFDLASVLTAPATPVAASGSLVSAEFGWQLPALGPEWIVTERFAEPGYDRIGLRNGVSLFEIESVINHHGDPVQCVLDELHLLQEFEDRADIRLWEDAGGNTEGGRTTSSAWVVYRVEPLAEERADQEYVIRIDCFTLIPGSANVVMKHIAPVDAWVEEAPKGDSLRDGLVLPEAVAPRAKLVVSAHDRRMDMIYIHWVDTAA